MDIRNTPIEPDCFYHIFNRGVNGEVIFKSQRNYIFFLKKIKDNLWSVCDLYAYCLMSNHFHLLVKIKSDQELRSIAEAQKLNLGRVSNPAKVQPETGLHSPQNIFSKRFSNLFNSYSQAFNKENNRHGPLIESPFKRKLITSEKYVRDCIIYIHQNPASKDFTDYPYSSFKSLTSESITFLKRNEVIELFDSVENFVFCHQKETDGEF